MTHPTSSGTLGRNLILCFLFSVLLGALPAAAQSIDYRDGKTLKAVSQGRTIFEVAPISKQELDTLKTWIEKPGPKTLRAENGTIHGGPVKLVVTDSIAKSWKSQKSDLAKLFIHRIKQRTQPKSLSWKRSSQVVPLGETRVVVLLGLAEGETVDLQSSQASVASIEKMTKNKYRLTGNVSGSTKLSAVSSRGRRVPDLPVWVKPWSARWSGGPGTFKYWGTASPSRVQESLSRWLKARALTTAVVTLERAESDEDGVLAFQVTARARGALPVDKILKVRTSLRPSADFQAANSLLLSNHPERIVEEGVLFRRQAEGPSLRFMWHHRNDPEGPERHLVVQLSNPTPSPRRFRVVWSSFGPSPDEIHVGHTATLGFVAKCVQGMGEEWTLPPNGSRTVEIRSMKAGQTVSGMALLHDLSGSRAPVELSVLATDTDRLPTAEAVSRDRGRTASGVFPGEILKQATHRAGGPYTYLEFGGEPFVSDLSEGHPSYGNFGTVYRTRLMLTNPSEEANEVVIGFASGGGAARGVVVLDGEVYDLPMGKTGDGIPMTRLRLEPGERRQVNVDMFPQAGSNYPVRLVVKSTFQRLEALQLEPFDDSTVQIP